LACSNLYLQLGVQLENITMFDKDGVLHTNRTDLLPIQMHYAKDVQGISLADAVKGSDMFLGLSAPNVLTPEMLLTMNDNPIVLHGSEEEAVEFFKNTGAVEVKVIDKH